MGSKLGKPDGITEGNILIVGSEEGTTDGFKDGLGSPDGMTDGFKDGTGTPDGTTDGFKDGTGTPDGIVDGFNDGIILSSDDLTTNIPSSTLLSTITPELKNGYTPHTPSRPLPDLFGVVSKRPTSSSTPFEISDKSNIRKPPR